MSRLTGLAHSALMWRGIAVGIAVAIVVMAAEVWTPVLGLSRGVQDYLYRLPMGREQEVLVLAVQLGAEPLQPMGPLLDRLAAARPRAILLSGGAPELEEGSLAAGRHPGIPFLAGVSYAPSSEDPDRYDPQQNPPPGVIPWAPRVLPPPEQGILRTQFWSVNTPEGIRPTLEGRLAADILHRPPKGERFGVDFRGLQNRIPRVEAGRVLGGEIPASLFQGRVILVGQAGAASVVTPLDGSYLPITDLEFHAAAVNTVLHGEGLAPLPLPLEIGLLAFAASLFYLLFRRHDPSRGVAWTMIGGLLQGLLGWVFLAGPGILWPILPLAASQFTGALVAQLDRYVEHRDLLRIMVLDSGRHLPATAQTAQEADPGTYWGFIGTFLEQFLHVKRSVFLVRSGAEPRVAEAWAFQCDFSAIREQRRDYRREPFTQALKAAGPYQPKNRPFLHPDPGERQYLIPLVAYGDVEGFWVVGLPEGADPLQAEEDLKPFALQIAEMLYARRNRRRKDARQLRDEFFSSLTVWSALRTLRRQTGELDRNYRMLDALFDHLSTPSLIYDLFGRVVRKNPAMASLLARRNIRTEQQSLLDLVHMFTGAEREEIQIALRHAILHRESQIFRSEASGAPHLRVTLKPLALESGSGALSADQPPRPFGLEGLVLEVEDGPGAQGGGLAPLASGALTDSPPLAGGGLQQLMDWTHVLEHEQPAGRIGTHLPNRAIAAGAFQEALKHVDDLLLSRRVTVQADDGPPETPVVANAMDLPQVFASVLYFLVEDARKDSSLQAAWSEYAGFLVLTLANEGHGLPGQAFQSLLERESPLGTPSLRSLVASRRLLESWGARMEAESDFGQGARVRVYLKRHGAES